LKLCQSASSSGTLVLPKMMAPASIRRWVATALPRDMFWRMAGMPQVVGDPVSSKDSLMVMGRPCSGPHISPRASAASALRAWARAPSTSIQMMALSAGLKRSTRRR
jgi:hypothetical protein